MPSLPRMQRQKGWVGVFGSSRKRRQTELALRKGREGLNPGALRWPDGCPRRILTQAGPLLTRATDAPALGPLRMLARLTPPGTQHGYWFAPNTPRRLAVAAAGLTSGCCRALYPVSARPPSRCLRDAVPVTLRVPGVQPLAFCLPEGELPSRETFPAWGLLMSGTRLP